MDTRILLHLIVCTMVLAPSVVWGKSETPTKLPFQPQYSYAVKFVCGVSSERFQEGVVKGVHATAVNILNPNLKKKVHFLKKMTRAFPYQMPGPMTEFESGVIGPHQAIEVECNEIRKRLPSPMTTEFRTGFVLILTDSQLNITAVYTSRPRDAEVSAIDIQTIQPQRIATSEPEKLPDLTVTEILMEKLRVKCGGKPVTCVTVVPITIANIGEAAATSFNTKVVLDPGQTVTVNQASVGLAPGSSQSFTATTPPGGNCFDPDCTVCVMVDDKAEVVESNETNNLRCETRQG